MKLPRQTYAQLRQIPIIEVALDCGLTFNRHNRTECPANHSSKSRYTFSLSIRHNFVKCFHATCEANKPLDPLALRMFVTGENILTAARYLLERFGGEVIPPDYVLELKLALANIDAIELIYQIKNEILIQHRLNNTKTDIWDKKYYDRDVFIDGVFEMIDDEYRNELSKQQRIVNQCRAAMICKS